LRAGTDRLTILQNDATFTPLSLAAGAVTSGGATINVSAADIGKFAPGEIYFLTNGSAAAFGTVTGISGLSVNFNNGDTYGLNQGNSANGFFSFVSANGTLPATLKRMRLINYSVTDTGLLLRRAFGVQGRGHTDSIIAEHITALDFRYILNLSDAGGALRQPVTQPLTVLEENSVRQVEANIAAETQRPLQNTGQRANFSAAQQISIRNLQFREAPQPTSGVIE
jgi:hypothetical protein